MANSQTTLATLLCVVDPHGKHHKVLCQAEVTLVAVEAWVSDNIPGGRVHDMEGVAQSLITPIGTPKGEPVAPILNLTSGV